MPYLRDAEGNVYLETDNPQEAWSPEEWEALKADKRAEIEEVHREIKALPQPDPAWPPEAQAMAASFVDLVLGRVTLQERLATLQTELSKLEAV